MAGLLLCLINCKHHGTQKRWLRARQVISSVGVEQSSIILNFKKEVLDHTARQVDSSVADQAQNNEVAIPTVHFIESAARHDILVRQVEQPMGLDTLRVELAELVDRSGQVFDCNVTVRVKFF